MRSTAGQIRNWIMGSPRKPARCAVYVVEFRGARISCSRRNKLELKLLTDPENYDWPNFVAVTSIVRPGSVCLDIGANVGVYSMVMDRLGAEVHAFEPVAHIRRRLSINRALNRANVVINDFALGDHTGELPMLQVKEDAFRGGTSTFVRSSAQRTGLDGFDLVPVKVCRLDEYSEGFERLDFIKLDVEGFELKVLTGGKRTLERFQAGHPFRTRPEAA